MSSRVLYLLRCLLPALLAAFVLFGCSNAKRANRGKPLRNYSANHLVKQNEKEDLTYEWLGMKLSADLSTEGESQSFKANIRIKRDSIIWISISPALGVEMVRVIITPDSVWYVSKVPNDKHYYLGDFGVIKAIVKIDVDFQMIQNLLIGNAILMDKREDNLNVLIDDQQYMLISKFDRKLKKLLDMDEKEVLPNTVLTVDKHDRDFQKIQQRATVDELMVKRFWLNGYNFKLERSLFNDLHNQRNIEVVYDDFEEESGQFYPQKVRLKVSDDKGWQQLEFKTSRIRLDKTFDFPFEIPEDYERRY
jgi:hypothetical protein